MQMTACSRLRGPMSKGICENSKALGTCQVKRNFTPRLRRGGGILWAYVWGKVRPFEHWIGQWAQFVQGEDLLLHTNRVQ